MGMRTPLSILDRAITRSAFPKIGTADVEASKINAARIAIGTIMFWRTALIVAATYYYHPTDVTEAQITAKFLLGCSMLTLLAMYTAGFCTPLTGLMLIASYPYFDARLLTGTLGTNVASLCLATMLLLNTGTRYSVDAYLLQRRGALGRLSRGMYSIVGSPNAVQIVRIYFLAFTAYAVISFGALVYHINDEYWREGRTVGIMLTNAYLSRFYEVFRTLESAAPSFYRVATAMCVAGQSIFQIAMFPLMFLLWGRRFVVAWGIVFFTISFVCLQLSYLPYLELVLWGLIFARMSPQSEPNTETIQGQRPPIVTAYTGTIAIALALFLVIWFAPGGRAWSGHAWDRPQRVLAWIGLDAPQVFNEADLQMGEKWPVIYRVHASGNRALVPLTGEDGERLAYHKNDLLYFGNSLRWHRRMIESDPEFYNRPGETGFEQLREVCYYDYVREQITEPMHYEVRIFENRSARPQVAVEQRYVAHELLAFDIEIAADQSYYGD
jgi:hypothetical protein